MNIEEVIEQLEDLKEYCSKSVRGKADTWYKDVEALDKVIEIAEKEIPRKIYHKQWNGIDGVPYDLCPNCKTNLCTTGLFPNEKEKYCGACGQKLDWEG